MSRCLPFLALLIVGCGGGGSTAVTPTPPLVCFSTDRHGNEEVYVTDSVGQYLLRLTNDVGEDHQPAFSQDNARVVFSSDRNGNDDLYVIDADGTNLKRLTTSVQPDNCARFSFDGSRIVFQRGSSTTREIWVMDNDGSNQTQVTKNAFNDQEPSWTPDGRILFTSNRSGKRQIYRMDEDGTNVTQLTIDATAECYQVDVRPDGKKLAFILQRNGASRTHFMDADGSKMTDMGHGDEEFWPRWSPSGNRLVVTAVIGGNEDVYRMNPDGSAWTKLTHTAFPDGHGDW